MTTGRKDITILVVVSMSNKNARKAKNEELAEFHLAVYSRAREMQRLRSGLLSNYNAVRLTTWEFFVNAVTTISNCINHIHVFAKEGYEEQSSLQT